MYLTDDIPGVGGRIKARPDDFLVEEQPLYQPSGEGEHLMLYVEKRGAATTDMVRRLAKLFRVRRSDIGYAGLKDKHAITRQHLTVHLPGRVDPDEEQKRLENIRHTPFKLLWAERTTTKLRRGHLAGNRFVIYIRDVDPTAVLRARPILDMLTRCGVPNYFGEQRFGYRHINHQIGRALLLNEFESAMDLLLGHSIASENVDIAAGREAYQRGDYDTALSHWPKYAHQERHALDLLRQGVSKSDAAKKLDEEQRRFFLNALQSDLFNRVLEKRLQNKTFDRLLPGDLAYKHDNGSIFTVDADTATLENSNDGRIPSQKVSPSGPIWGADMMQPTDAVATLENEVLAECDLTESDLASLRGSRRSLRVPLRDPDIAGGVDENGPYIRLSFELPPGAYATVVLQELMKTDGLNNSDEQSDTNAPQQTPVGSKE